jgi:transposase
VFYKKLNELLAEGGFDPWVEEVCAAFYADGKGRESIPPGTYFRMLLVGYFEVIGSQRGIARRCSDSLSIRDFLGIPANRKSPDHSSLSVIRERLSLEVHGRVFNWILQLAREKKLLKGKTVAVDSTTLEANAAMTSIQRIEPTFLNRVGRPSDVGPTNRPDNKPRYTPTADGCVTSAASGYNAYAVNL